MKKRNWLYRWDQVRIERGCSEPKFKNKRSESIEIYYTRILKGIWKRSSQLAWLGVIDSGGANEM